MYIQVGHPNIIAIGKFSQMCFKCDENPCFHCLKGLRPPLLCRDLVLFLVMSMISAQNFVMQFRLMLQRSTKGSTVQFVRNRHRQELMIQRLNLKVSSFVFRFEKVFFLLSVLMRPPGLLLC